MLNRDDFHSILRLPSKWLDNFVAGSARRAWLGPNSEVHVVQLKSDHDFWVALKGVETGSPGMVRELHIRRRLSMLHRSGFAPAGNIVPMLAHGVLDSLTYFMLPACEARGAAARAAPSASWLKSRPSGALAEWRASDHGCATSPRHHRGGPSSWSDRGSHLGALKSLGWPQCPIGDVDLGKRPWHGLGTLICTALVLHRHCAVTASACHPSCTSAVPAWCPKCTCRAPAQHRDSAPPVRY